MEDLAKNMFRLGDKEFDIRFYDEDEKLYQEEKLNYFEFATWILTHKVKKIYIFKEVD